MPAADSHIEPVTILSRIGALPGIRRGREAAYEAGSWYVDLVSIVESSDTIEVVDRDIDIIVPAPGAPYRVVDVHEFGDAIESGEHSLQDAIAGLRAFQAFLETHLNRPDGSTGPWPDFPPAAIEPLMNVALPAILAERPLLVSVVPSNGPAPGSCAR